MKYAIEHKENTAIVSKEDEKKEIDPETFKTQRLVQEYSSLVSTHDLSLRA